MTEKDILYKNDKIIKRLLELKKEKHGLSFSEKRKLKRYNSLFPYHQAEELLINKIFMESDLVSTKREQDSYGNLINFEMWINDNSIKALKGNYFKSQIQEMSSNKSNKILIIINAIITLILVAASVFLTWLQSTNSNQNLQLNKLENDVRELKIKYDTL